MVGPNGGHRTVALPLNTPLSRMQLIRLMYMDAEYGMQKGGTNDNHTQWLRCAKLAVAWDRCEIARHNIFNAENRFHWEVGFKAPVTLPVTYGKLR